jgi:Methyltransferase domain
VGFLGRFKQAVMQRSRDAKLKDFYSHCSQECDVLDVGVSNNDHSPQVNLFLKKFRFPPRRYTGLAVEPIGELAAQFPEHRFIEYDGKVFPFRDRQFGFAFSNAVIEHVGDTKDQVRFLNEMLRTSDEVFFTTPNKYFPVESHTNALIVHWFPSYFYRWCKRNSPYWNEQNLRLLSYADLKAVVGRSDAEPCAIKRNRLLGLTMTFTVVCRRRAESTTKVQ